MTKTDVDVSDAFEKGTDCMYLLYPFLLVSTMDPMTSISPHSLMRGFLAWESARPNRDVEALANVDRHIDKDDVKEVSFS